MAYAAQQRNKDHWSMRLHVKRPGGVHPVALVLALVQTVLLAATASSLASTSHAAADRSQSGSRSGADD